MTPSYPTLFASSGWYTTSFIAKRLNLPLRTIQYWCKTGFFVKRGCPTISTGNTSRIFGSSYWVYIPPTSKDAMLSKVPLDKPSISVIR